VIIIIGAGITGLSAAFELARRDTPFLLLERGSRAGGLLHTEQVEGFTVEAGADSLLAQKPAGIELCEQLGLSGRLMGTSPPRTAYVLKGDRLYPLPRRSVLGLPTALSSLAAYDLLPLMSRARLALEPFVPPGAFAEESVAAFFRRRFGAQTVGLIAAPLLGGIHAGDIEQLSVHSLFPRLVETEQLPGRVLRNLSATTAPGPGGAFRALRGGMSELVSTIETRLPAGSLRLDAAVTSLTRSDSGWRVGVSGESLEAAAVLIACPAHVAAELLAPLDAAAAGIASGVPYVSTASVALGFRRSAIDHPLSGSGFVVARGRSDRRITACTWVSSKWQDRAPEAHALLRTFLGGAHDPAVCDLSDDELIETAVRDLTPVMRLRSAPSMTRVYRWRRAGAQYVVGHRGRMLELRARLDTLPGLFAAGAGFEAIGVPDCIAHGRRAAASAWDYVTMGSDRRRERRDQR
jgi:oxygen-dependent protoporphyrinogen oxidase